MKSRIELKKEITKSSMKTIELLEKILAEKEDSTFVNLLIVIKSDLNKTIELDISGVSDKDDYRRGINRVNVNILKIIDDLPSHYFDEQEEVSGTKEYDKDASEISSLIRELSELEIREADSNNQNTKGYINSKRHIIAIQVIRMIEQTQVSISSLEYSLIAYSFYRSVDIIKAEQIYKKAIGNIDVYTDSAQSKINAMRSYANFLYNISRYNDGAKQYESAILEGDTETSNVINGYTYQSKFANESDIPNYENALISYKTAKEFYMKIRNNIVRNHNLNDLATIWNSKNIPPSYSRP